MSAIILKDPPEPNPDDNNPSDRDEPPIEDPKDPLPIDEPGGDIPIRDPTPTPNTDPENEPVIDPPAPN